MCQLAQARIVIPCDASVFEAISNNIQAMASDQLYLVWLTIDAYEADVFHGADRCRNCPPTCRLVWSAVCCADIQVDAWVAATSIKHAEIAPQRNPQAAKLFADKCLV